MNVTVEPYEARWEPAVRAFNGRLEHQEGPVRFQFPERSVPEWLPPQDGRRIYQTGFVAIDDRETVRGGYILRVQEFWINGETRTVGNLQLPLSEGLIDPRFRFLGVQLVRDALRRQPLLYSLGMGGLDGRYPRLLKGLGWSLWLLPFWFRVVDARRCFRELSALRSSPGRRAASDVMAWSGLGWIGTRLAHAGIALRAGGLGRADGLQAGPVDTFGPSSDTVWETGRREYAFAACRDRSTLAALFETPCFPSLHFLECTRQGRPVGWVVLSDSRMSGHRHFGDLRVGGLIDGFAALADVPAVVRVATRHLLDRGVDLIVSNQSHRAWCNGLRAAGYMNGPSNFALALSKGLDAVATAAGIGVPDMHFNRGDGDGPIHL